MAKQKNNKNLSALNPFGGTISIPYFLLLSFVLRVPTSIVMNGAIQTKNSVFRISLAGQSAEERGPSQNLVLFSITKSHTIKLVE